MTAVTAGGAHRRPGAAARISGLDQPDVLRRIQRAGYLTLGIQLLCFMIWSQILWRRFALTVDFASVRERLVPDCARSVRSGEHRRSRRILAEPQ